MLRAVRRVQRPADRRLESGLIPDYPLLTTRRTWRWIDRDLGELEGSEKPDSRPVADTDFGWLQTTPQAIGVLYVLEGATLGGSFLAKLAADQLGLGAMSGASYFSAYGRENASRWRLTREWIDATLDDTSKQDQAAGAALETFSAFQAVLEGSS